jgi:cell division septation protein DedD/nucleoid DNA-binding protein
MQIESIVIQHLTLKSRVQIPGWGSFFLVEKQAQWDAVTNTAFPRGKYVAFNPSHTTTENTLLPAVMKAMGCTMEVAESWILRKVNQWQKVLDSGSVLMLPGLGSFRKNGSFTPEKNNQFDPNAFGLTAIRMYALSEPSALETKVAASLKMVVEQREHGAKAWRKAAVAAAITALVSLGVYQSEITHEMAGWFTPSPVIQLDHSDRRSAETQEEISPSEVEAEAVITPASKPVVKTRVSTKLEKGYCIVVGSFKMEENATTLAADLKKKGMDVQILSGSLMKVGVGSYANREAAKSDLASIQASVNSHAWICAY